jgi:hypothetical protein
VGATGAERPFSAVFDPGRQPACARARPPPAPSPPRCPPALPLPCPDPPPPTRTRAEPAARAVQPGPPVQAAAPVPGGAEWVPPAKPVSMDGKAIAPPPPSVCFVWIITNEINRGAMDMTTPPMARPRCRASARSTSRRPRRTRCRWGRTRTVGR